MGAIRLENSNQRKGLANVQVNFKYTIIPLLFAGTSDADVNELCTYFINCSDKSSCI